jgi:hypothetical protein
MLLHDEDAATTYKEGFRYLIRRFGKPVEVLITRVTHNAYKVRIAGALLEEWHEIQEFEHDHILIEDMGMDAEFLPAGFLELYHHTLLEYDYDGKLSKEALKVMPPELANAMKAASIYFPMSVPTTDSMPSAPCSMPQNPEPQ